MRDTLAIGAIAGIAGTIIMHLFATAEHALGLINMTSMEVSGALLLNPALLATTTGQGGRRCSSRLFHALCGKGLLVAQGPGLGRVDALGGYGSCTSGTKCCPGTPSKRFNHPVSHRQLLGIRFGDGIHHQSVRGVSNRPGQIEPELGLKTEQRIGGV